MLLNPITHCANAGRVIFDSVSHWLTKRELLLVELGNCSTKLSLFEVSGNRCYLKDESCFPSESYHNGKIRQVKHFADAAREAVADFAPRSNVVVGLDSSHITHSMFTFSKGSNRSQVLSKIESTLDNKKIIYSRFQGSKVSILAINAPILDRIHAVFRSCEIEIMKFIPTKAFNIGSGLRTIVDIGYRTTNVSIFEDDFLVSYNTIEIGIERVFIAVAKKFNISLEDARLSLEEVSMFDRDDTKWMRMSQACINKRYLSTFLRVYLEAFLKKVLSGGIADMPIYLTGWAQKISGLANILENTKCIPDIDKSKLVMRI